MTLEEACLLRIARQLKREVDEFRSLLRRNREIKEETDLELIRLKPRIYQHLQR